MGNQPNAAGGAPVSCFYSEKSWVEGAAIDQLHRVAAMDGVTAVAAMPDLHPGKYGPVGCAVLSSNIHPELVGSDIGCGMALFALDGTSRRLRLDKAAEKLRILAEPWEGDGEARLAEAGLEEAGFASSLGTVGGGNHFCEVQAVQDVLDSEALRATNLEKDSLCLLVHSGSRGLGGAVLADLLSDGLVHLLPDSDGGRSYRARHDMAVRWATLNRQVIAERAGEALRMDVRLIVDAPHNLLSDHAGLVLHRKGVARADADPSGLVPVAGSRGTLSHVVRWNGHPGSLASVSHGSGRKYDRASARARGGGKKSDLERLLRNPFGGYVICEDKSLLIEEGPEAYKDSTRVIADLVSFKIADHVASLRPLVTYKTAREQRR